MKDNYNNWVERVMGGRNGKPLSVGESVGTSADDPEPFSPIRFARLEKDLYIAEVGKKGGDYVYHFYPSDKVKGIFEDKMGDAFIAIFKKPEQIEAVYTEELGSWAVRARGFADTLWGDDLAIRVFDKLDSLLENVK